MLVLVATMPAHHIAFTQPFRIGTDTVPYRAAVSWYGSSREDDFNGGIVKLDLYVLTKPKHLVTSTVLDDFESMHVWSRSVRGATYRSPGGITVGLVAFDFMGQFNQTYLFYIDPKTLRPRRMEGYVLQGGTRRLDSGQVIEHSPDHYVERKDWPKGEEPPTRYVCRTWQFDAKAMDFIPGRWRWYRF